MQTAMTPFRGALTRRDERRLRLFTTTAGKDLRGAEIDEAIEWCELYGANPFTRDIYFFVFDADKPDKRRVIPVCSIGLYRKIAARSGTYRPADKGPAFTYDDALRGTPTNPRGIVDCTATVYQYAHGEWHPVVGHVRWEERAPLKQMWRNNQPTGEFQLDPKKTNWATMPETMLAKCAEADALRKGWPEQVGGMYVEGELDAAKTIELTATEILEKGDAADRQSRLGGRRLHVQWKDGEQLDAVPIGEFYDRVDEFITKNKDELSTVLSFELRNRLVMQDFWAHDKNAALDLKQKLDAIRNADE